MKTTPIARIRVSYEDAMSIVDLLKQSGLPIEEMGFNSMVGLVLSGNLQSLRDKGTVPTRHPDEYEQIAAPYIVDRKNKDDLQKLMVARAVQGKGFQLAAYQEEEHEADLPEGKSQG